MPGRSGLDILQELHNQQCAVPLFIISGQGDIPMAVDAIRNGALDFIEKPFNAATLVTRVREAIAAAARQAVQSPSGSGLAARFPGRELLTPREYQVLELIANGASNKEAGRRLGISPRTIEVHRARIMDKLGAKNAADLVRITLNDSQRG
jgi:FixJ family two-component response regulator